MSESSFLLLLTLIFVYACSAPESQERYKPIKTLDANVVEPSDDTEEDSETGSNDSETSETGSDDEDDSGAKDDEDDSANQNDDEDDSGAKDDEDDSANQDDDNEDDNANQDDEDDTANQDDEEDNGEDDAALLALVEKGQTLHAENCSGCHGGLENDAKLIGKDQQAIENAWDSGDLSPDHNLVVKPGLVEGDLEAIAAAIADLEN